MSIQPFSDYDLLPTYLRVADDLRSKLGSLGFEIGTYLPGEHEIAAQYHLSRGTIRRALGILESEGLLSRQPGRGTLILPPNRRKHLKKPKIAIVWTMERWMGLGMFQSLEEQLSTANCELLFNSSNHDPQKEIHILHNLLESEIDAVVLYSTGHPESQALIQKFLERGKPVVLLDRYVMEQKEPCSWVSSDNEQGAYEMTRYLIGLGHRQVAMYILTSGHQPERLSTLIEREAGYLRAMEEAGLEPLLMKPSFLDEDTNKAFEQDLIQFIDRNQPSAIFFHNDVSAFRVYNLLARHHIRVPEEISIAGFDGLKLFDELFTFDLTTVEQDFSGLGAESGKMILALIRNPNSSPRHMRLPVKLHIGNTTAPPRPDRAFPKSKSQNWGDNKG